MDLFSAAEMKHAERRNMLGLAFQKAFQRQPANLHVREFVMWVFNATHGGIDGQLKKTYKELSYAPWGLCCSVSKVRGTVKWAIERGFIESTEDRYATGGQSANNYQIDWDGIRALLGFSPTRENGKQNESHVVENGSNRPDSEAESRAGPGVSTRHPPVLSRQGGVLTEQGGVLTEHPCNRNSPLNSPLNSNRTGTGTGRGVLTEHPVENMQSGTGTDAIACPRPGPKDFDLNLPTIRGVRWEDWPELAELHGRPVKPAPLGHVRGGMAFRFFQPKHFRLSTGSPRACEGRPAIIHWFREQLSLSSPVFPGNVAFLALVLAAAEDAATKPDQEIKTTRVRYFVDTVSHGYWQRCVHCLPNVFTVFEDKVDA